MPRKPPTKQRSRLTLRAAVQVGAVDAADPKKPRTFRMVANTGEPMRIWPFEYPVVVDLDTIDVSGLPVPALYDHCPDVDFAVGNVLAATVEAGEFVASGRFTVDESIPAERNYAKKVLNKADAGYVWQTSIGGDPASTEEIKAGASVIVNGRTYAGPVIVARGVQLREISFVVLGGDRRTSAVVARHRSIKGSAMTFEEYVQSMGFDPADLDATQSANLKIQFAEAYPEGAGDVSAEDAPTDDEIAAMDTEEEVQAAIDDVEEDPPTNAAAVLPKLRARLKKIQKAARREQRIQARRDPTPAPTPVKAGRNPHGDAATAERTRVVEISKLTAEHGNPKVKARDGSRGELSIVATAEGWTVDRVKTHLLEEKRKSRPQGPTVITPAAPGKDDQLAAMQAAIILRAGKIALDNKHLANTPSAVAMGLPAWMRQSVNADSKARILEAAHKLGSLHAMDIARECVRLDGKSFAANSRDSIIQAAFSGMSLTNVFTTNINATMLATYMEAPDTTVGWTTEADVGDFRTNERPRLTKGAGLTKHAKNTEADHMTRGDVGESYKIAPYTGQIVLAEEDLVNDALGATADLPVEMGNAAARLRPDLVYSILLNNANLAATARALFNTTDGNTATGGTLAAATLRTAISAMMARRENSVNLNLMPSHLIVPTSLFLFSGELATSAQLIIAGTAGAITERGAKNVISDLNLQVVGDGRLENGLVDPDSGTTLSGSSTTWYLASNMGHTIEVGYLRGTGRAPRVRPFKLDRGQWGVGWDVRMEIGAKALDWKALERRQT